MDDVIPRIGLQVWIIVEIFTGNDGHGWTTGWLDSPQGLLQALQVLDEFLILNIILVQSGPNGCGERASSLPVFGGVLHEGMEVIGQGRHVPVKEVAEVFLAVLAVVVQPGGNSTDNKHGRNLVALSNIHDHRGVFLW